MNKRRRGYQKHREKTRKQTEKQRIYKEIKRDVNKANDRLKSLERHVKTGTYASKKLRNRLNTKTINSWSGKNRIRINENMTVTQLKAVQKATRQFLNSKTSTYKGIKEVSDSTIDSLKQEFDIDETTLTRDDYADIYDLFGTNEFSNLVDYIPSSDLIALLTDTREYNFSEEQFMERLNILQDVNDLDIQEKAKKLYNKFMG